MCIYKGDLVAARTRRRQTVSAYAVVWSSPPSNDQPDVPSWLTLTVTNDVVKAGGPSYVFDKTTGNITSAIGMRGDLVVTFVKDLSIPW